MSNVPDNTLFQVPIAMVDILNASRIQSQRPVNPGNCGAASGLLLGLVTVKMAEYLSAWDLSAPSAWSNHWEYQLSNDGNQYSSVILKFKDVGDIKRNLFLSCGTIVGIRHPDKPIGHFVVIAKDMNNVLMFIDLQNGKLFSSDSDVINYVASVFNVPNTEEGLAPVELHVFNRNVVANLPQVLYFFYLYRSRALLTNDQVTEIARNNPIPDPNADITMSLGGLRPHKTGKTRKTRNTRKTRKTRRFNASRSHPF